MYFTLEIVASMYKQGYGVLCMCYSYPSLSRSLTHAHNITWSVRDFESNAGLIKVKKAKHNHNLYSENYLIDYLFSLRFGFVNLSTV